MFLVSRPLHSYDTENGRSLPPCPSSKRKRDNGQNGKCGKHQRQQDLVIGEQGTHDHSPKPHPVGHIESYIHGSFLLL